MQSWSLSASYVGQEPKAIDVMVQQAVHQRLSILRDCTRPGRNNQMPNRVVARRFNSFEPDRMQSKAFIGVQNMETLRKYSAIWSQQILFLLRIQRSDHDTLAEALLYPDDTLQTLVDDVTASIETLRGSNEDDLSIEECLNDSISHLRELRVHAEALIETIDRLSVYLVKQTCQQDTFSLPVVAYSSLHALGNHGAWKAATEYRPFLSAMIHCMQLWLIGHCIQYCRVDQGNRSMQDYATEQCRLHLVNTSNGAIAELSYWRLMARSAKNDIPRPPTTTMTDDCMQVNHASLELRLPAWRHFLRDILYEADSLLTNELLFKISGLAVYPASSLYDDLARTEPGWSFLQDGRNGLSYTRDRIVDILGKDPELRRRFFLESDTQLGRDEQLLPNRPPIEDYLHADKRFLQLLAILFIMTAGLPPRRPELLGIHWCNQETPRNIYIHDGLLAVLTSYHKSRWRVGTRPIARFLPPSVGDLVVRYLIYVVPVVHLFGRCMQYPLPRGALFRTEQGIWTSSQLSAAVKLHSQRLLGLPIKISQWRHIAIALDRRLLQGVACQVYHIDPDSQMVNDNADSDSDPDDCMQAPRSQPFSTLTASNIHSLQAAHTLETGVTHYGNSRHAISAMTDVLLADYTRVSRQWHQLCQLPAPDSIACSHKRAVSVTAEQGSHPKRMSTVGRLHTRRQLWIWPTIQQGLERLLGPHATVRDSMQRDALRLLASSQPEIVLVMPTGSGKSLLYMVMSVLNAAEVTIVIMPLVALRQDLIRRCTEKTLPYWHYRSRDRMLERLHAVPSLVLVDVEEAVTPSFNTFAKQLLDTGRLDRIVIDEAHLILTAADYREHLGLLAILRQIACPLVCLTATLPPYGELDLKQALFLTYPVIYRASSDRPNLEYCVQTIGPLRMDEPKESPSREEILVTAVEEVYRKDSQTWHSGGSHPTARSLFYVRSRNLGTLLARRLGCDFYHAQLNPVDRISLLTAWYQAIRSPYLVATNALGAGLDYPSIRMVVHVDAPSGLVDYGQETGRAGRDGLHATCLTILPPKWSINWDRRYRSDFLQEDGAQMGDFLRTSECLRQRLTFYLDGALEGRHGIHCSQADGIPRVACSSCRRKAEEPRTTPSTQAQIGSGQVESSSPALPKHDDEESQEDTDDDTGACSPTTVSSDEEPLQEEETWNAVNYIRQLAIMTDAETQAFYERRLAAWGRACILCSFHTHQRTSFPHRDCMQGRYSEALGDFRRGVRFEHGIGCFACGQPSVLCPKKGKGGCQYPWFVWHCCWVAVHEDRLHAEGLLQALGCPSIPSYVAMEQQTRFMQWLGKGCRVFGWKGSNALRVACTWIDRLETLCNSTSSVDS